MTDEQTSEEIKHIIIKEFDLGVFPELISNLNLMLNLRAKEERERVLSLPKQIVIKNGIKYRIIEEKYLQKRGEEEV